MPPRGNVSYVKLSLEASAWKQAFRLTFGARQLDTSARGSVEIPIRAAVFGGESTCVASTCGRRSHRTATGLVLGGNKTLLITRGVDTIAPQVR